MDHPPFRHFQQQLKSRKSIKTNFAVFLLTFTYAHPNKLTKPEQAPLDPKPHSLVSGLSFQRVSGMRACNYYQAK